MFHHFFIYFSLIAGYIGPLCDVSGSKCAEKEVGGERKHMALEIN